MNNLQLKDIYFYPPKIKIILILFLCGTIFFVGYLFDIKNLRNQITNINPLLLEQRIRHKQNQINLAEKQKTRATKLKAYYAIHKNKLHQEITISALAKNMANAGSNNGVILKSVLPSTHEIKDWLLQHNIQITATGNYDHLISFIKALTKLPYVIDLKDFKLAMIKNQHNNLALHALIVIYTKHFEGKK